MKERGRRVVKIGKIFKAQRVPWRKRRTSPKESLLFSLPLTVPWWSQTTVLKSLHDRKRKNPTNISLSICTFISCYYLVVLCIIFPVTICHWAMISSNFQAQLVGSSNGLCSKRVSQCRSDGGELKPLCTKSLLIHLFSFLFWYDR